MLYIINVVGNYTCCDRDNVSLVDTLPFRVRGGNERNMKREATAPCSASLFVYLKYPVYSPTRRIFSAQAISSAVGAGVSPSRYGRRSSSYLWSAIA